MLKTFSPFELEMISGKTTKLKSMHDLGRVSKNPYWIISQALRMVSHACK